MRMRGLYVCYGCAMLALSLIAAGCGGGGGERAGQPGEARTAAGGISGTWVTDLGTLEITQEPGESFDHLKGSLTMESDGRSMRFSVEGSLTPPDKVSMVISFRGYRAMTLTGTVKGDTMSGEVLDNEGKATGEWSAKRK